MCDSGYIIYLLFHCIMLTHLFSSKVLSFSSECDLEFIDATLNIAKDLPYKHINLKFDIGKFCNPGCMSAEEEEEVIQHSVKCVRYCNFVGFKCVEYSFSGCGKVCHNFLWRLFSEVIKSGSHIVNIVDNEDYSSSEEFILIVQGVLDNVDATVSKTIWSVECHDYLGLGVYNTLQCIKSNIKRIKGTLLEGASRASRAVYIGHVVSNILAMPHLYETVCSVNTRVSSNMCSRGKEISCCTKSFWRIQAERYCVVSALSRSCYKDILRDKNACLNLHTLLSPPHQIENKNQAVFPIISEIERCRSAGDIRFRRIFTLIDFRMSKDENTAEYDAVVKIAKSSDPESKSPNSMPFISSFRSSGSSNLDALARAINRAVGAQYSPISYRVETSTISTGNVAMVTSSFISKLPTEEPPVAKVLEVFKTADWDATEVTHGYSISPIVSSISKAVSSDIMLAIARAYLDSINMYSAGTL